MKVNLHDLGLGNGFLVRTPKTYVTKKKWILDFIKVKTSVHQKTSLRK